MAGTVTHLVIADQLLDFFSIKNAALFYCGNLAPDAIMARENYVRAMKKYTHFKQDIPTDDFHIPANYQRYLERFHAFMQKNLDKNNPEYELYLGYVVHMLADEVFILKVRDVHVNRLRVGRESHKYVEYFKCFGHDVDLNDWRLVREYSFSHKMPDVLLLENGYEIRNYITAEELKKSKEFIIKKNFGSNHNEEKTKYFSYEENQNFIQQAVNYIKVFFTDGADFI